MISLDLRIKKSIYEQIVDGFKEEIVSGKLSPGDQLPSVRDLSARLTVNPNTIQKAFRALEEQGFTYSVTGRGSFVSDARKPASEVQVREIFERITAEINELRYLGMQPDEILRRIAQITEERRRGDDNSK